MTTSPKLPPKWMACAFFIAVAFSSCTDNGPGVFVPTPTDSSALGKINHFIPQDTIALFQRAFAGERDTLLRLRPNLFFPISETFNKAAMLQALRDPKCVGLRTYYGIKNAGDHNEVRLIIVGVDAQGRDLYIAEGGLAAQSAAQVSGGRFGGSEYGQCVPPCK